jgi:hypothetical protein
VLLSITDHHTPEGHHHAEEGSLKENLHEKDLRT